MGVQQVPIDNLMPVVISHSYERTVILYYSVAWGSISVLLRAPFDEMINVIISLHFEVMQDCL